MPLGREMRVLFVHQNFPGQFRNIVAHLVEHPRFEVAAIGMREDGGNGLHYRRYAVPPAPALRDMAIDDAVAKMRRAAAVAAQARLLRMCGFYPDAMVAHAGWGEALYLKDVFPRAKLVCYCEYHYLREGGDIGFDPEFPLASSDIVHRLRIRNALERAALDEAAACVSPTEWQRSTYPAALQSRIDVIHDGVDLRRLLPDTGAPTEETRRIGVDPARPTLTHAARHLEPHRGFHVFMRMLPELLEAEPDLQVLVVGSQTGGYGAPPESGQTWKEVLWQEVGRHLDPERVRFLGWLPHAQYVNVMRLSNVHLYLTYPFVLSWSALEALALGCAIVASDTPPVSEFMRDGANALLAGFFDRAGLISATRSLLSESAERARLKRAAKETIDARGLSADNTNKRWVNLLHGLH